MTRKKTKQGYIKMKNIANNIDSLYNRLWAHFVITPDESYYILEGRKVYPDEMNTLYPISELERNVVSKGKGLDGRVIL